MHLFYFPELSSGPSNLLPEEEAHHARVVLRLRVGDRIGLLNGKGVVAQADITSMDKREVQVSIVTEQRVEMERRALIHIAVAPTKQMERFEWMLEKCTEIGVDRITPLMTTRTERASFRRDRMERVLVGAMKQSQRAWIPHLDEMTAIHDLIRQDIPGQRWFGRCEGERSPLAACYRSHEDVVLLIGPEGDFTAEEAQQLHQHQFGAFSLGEARLRTETAAVTACAYMNIAQQV